MERSADNIADKFSLVTPEVAESHNLPQLQSLPIAQQPASSASSYRAPEGASGLPNDYSNSLTAPVSNTGRTKSIPPSGVPRFIGDLNPESIFHTTRNSIAAGQQRTPPEERTQRTAVGVWVPTDDGETTGGLLEPGVKSTKRKRGYTDAAEEPGDLSAGDTVTEPPCPMQIFNKYLEALHAYSLPPRSNCSALISLYIQAIHPFLPLVDSKLLLEQHNTDTIPILLLQSILLVICRHPSAQQHLMLPSPGSSQGKTIPPRVFADRVYASIKALLFAGTEKDRMTLIRVYALLSLHAEGSEGNERASRDLSIAIHHAHSVGIHIRRSSTTTSKEDEKEGSPTDVWWCLWSLDQIQAAMNGRPVLTRTEDVDIQLPNGVGGVDLEEWRKFRSIGQTEIRWVFGSWLRLAVLLQNVIALYRPGRENCCWELQWPTFEMIVNIEKTKLELDENDATSILGTLRIFHLAVAILSHRSRLPPQTLVMEESQARRINAAFQLLEVFPNQDVVHMPPLPMIPYAISLSMTAFYSILREPNFQSNNRREKEAYNRSCRLLLKLARWSWFAGTMARLGKEGIERLEATWEKGNNGEARVVQRIGVAQQQHDNSVSSSLGKQMDERRRGQWRGLNIQKPPQQQYSPHLEEHSLPNTPLSSTGSPYVESIASATTTYNRSPPFPTTPHHHAFPPPPFHQPSYYISPDSAPLPMPAPRPSYPISPRESGVDLDHLDVFLDLFPDISNPTNFPDISNPMNFYEANFLDNVVDGEDVGWQPLFGGG
ncbi:hypothetical protein RUND412_001561 [Rhizina undulata]